MVPIGDHIGCDEGGGLDLFHDFLWSTAEDGLDFGVDCFGVVVNSKQLLKEINT